MSEPPQERKFSNKPRSKFRLNLVHHVDEIIEGIRRKPKNLHPTLMKKKKKILERLSSRSKLRKEKKSPVLVANKKRKHWFPPSSLVYR